MTDSEAHHFLHVMRGKVGDRITLFDGSGYEFEADVAETNRREIVLTIINRTNVNREAANDLTIGVALPKGDRQKVLVEKLTELGVRRLVPLRTTRAVVVPKASALEKLRRGVIEASKQCGRNVLMEITEARDLTDFLTTTDAHTKRIAHPYEAPSLRDAQPSAAAAGSVAVAIGPEGGFTDEELAAAMAAGWQAMSMGRSILRIETAAIAAAAILCEP